MPDRTETNEWAECEDPIQTRMRITFAVLGIIVFFGIAYAGFTVQEHPRHAFMAKCIEFNTSARCSDLYEFGRLDLADRPGR